MDLKKGERELTEECVMLGDGESHMYDDTESAIHEYFGDTVPMNECNAPSMSDEEVKEVMNEN